MSNLHQELRHLYENDKEGIYDLLNAMRHERDEVHEVVERFNDMWVYNIQANNKLKTIQQNIRIVVAFILNNK